MRIPSYRGTSGLSINMTPMIDVTFLLIIFFLVSSHLAKQENFLKLDLPHAPGGANDANLGPTLTLQVLREGAYRIGSQTLQPDEVRRAIHQRNVAEGSLVRIRIRTDREASYERIANLLKICAETGNANVVFAVYDRE